jgi:hypothetical protein
MPNKIQIRRGVKSAMPQGSAGEPLWASDTKELYIGTGSGNVNMSGSHWYRGTAMSGTSTTANQYSYSACPEVKLDDIYMNTSNGNIYACTTAGKGTNAKWTYQGCIKGATGATGSSGANGKGISSSTVTYATSSSGTTTPSSWQSTIPSVNAGSYLWTRLVITYTDGATSTSYSVARQGSDASVTVDSVLSDTSVNPIQNKVVKEAIDGKANIKKNPNATDGDVISGHLTIGSRGEELVGKRSITIGTSCTSKFDDTISVGNNNQSNGALTAVLGGDYHVARGMRAAIVGGNKHKATGSASVVLGGCNNVADGFNSAALGAYMGISHDGHVAMGHYNLEGTNGSNSGVVGDCLIIGNGTNTTRSNAFRVAYNGSVYGKGAFNTTGADYAEMMEWLDGNSANDDRRGLFAYVEGDKIRLATSDDIDKSRIGIISATPAVVGDNYDDDWCDKYLTDVFGVILIHKVHHDAEYRVNEETNEKICIQEAYDAIEPILNPDYDPKQKYISRAERPEYDYWSFIGKLVAVDDGTCVAGGYCCPSENGIATSCTDSTKGFYVMERLDDTHIRVLMK